MDDEEYETFLEIQNSAVGEKYQDKVREYKEDLDSVTKIQDSFKSKLQNFKKIQVMCEQYCEKKLELDDIETDFMKMQEDLALIASKSDLVEQYSQSYADFNTQLTNVIGPRVAGLKSLKAKSESLKLELQTLRLSSGHSASSSSISNKITTIETKLSDKRGMLSSTQTKLSNLTSLSVSLSNSMNEKLREIEVRKMNEEKIQTYQERKNSIHDEIQSIKSKLSQFGTNSTLSNQIKDQERTLAQRRDEFKNENDHNMNQFLKITKLVEGIKDQYETFIQSEKDQGDQDDQVTELKTQLDKVEQDLLESEGDLGRIEEEYGVVTNFIFDQSNEKRKLQDQIQFYSLLFQIQELNASKGFIYIKFLIFLI